MDLEAMAAGVAPIIIAQFKDLCDIYNPTLVNTSGQVIEEWSTPTYTDIPCVYEAAYLRPFFMELPTIENSSAQQRFKLLMEMTAETETITAKTRIKIKARNDRPELLFEQPQRMEESISPLLVVQALLRNQ